jgi:hypothetical protein
MLSFGFHGLCLMHNFSFRSLVYRVFVKRKRKSTNIRVENQRAVLIENSTDIKHSIDVYKSLSYRYHPYSSILGHDVDDCNMKEEYGLLRRSFC